MNDQPYDHGAKPLPPEAPPPSKNAPLLVAGAVVAILLGAAYFVFVWGGANRQSPRARNGPLDRMAAITAGDHIRGNPNAPVKIVEYSDTECPFCKRFHGTMQQVMERYGGRGEVAWVYRHFPIPQLHPKAPREAEATECAHELGGAEKFWAYLDRLFTVTPSNDNLDPAELPKIADAVGLNVAQFTACLSSGRYASHVEAEVQNAVATGGSGTPWSIIVAADGTKYPLSGAQPYASVRQLIELALREKK